MTDKEKDFHGTEGEEAETEEGEQILGVLGKNMAWLRKSPDAGRREGLQEPEKEERIGTNYIR